MGRLTDKAFVIKVKKTYEKTVVIPADTVREAIDLGAYWTEEGTIEMDGVNLAESTEVVSMGIADEEDMKIYEMIER